MTNIYVKKPEETVVTNGSVTAPIPQVPIPKITYAQGGVATVTGQPTNYGNLMGGGTTPSTTYAGNGFGTDMSNATIPEYYKYAYDVGVQNAERTRYNDIQNARVTYNQFINPYGAVANQQAQAGFTGGGYSQFLQGQAYQSMIDSQNAARATEAATKQTLYGDYLKGMAEYNQAEKNKQEQTAVAAADLLNNIGTYSSLEAVDAALDALNITDAAQRKTYTDAWNNQVVSTFLNDIANNKFASWEDLKSLMASKGITSGDNFIKIANAWTENMYKNDNITEIVNAINSGTYATEEDLVSALDSKNITGETRNSLINQFRDAEKAKGQNILSFNAYVSGQEKTSPTSAEDIISYAKTLGLDVNSSEVQNAVTEFNNSQYLSRVENVLSMEGSQAEDYWEALLSDDKAFNSLTKEQQAEVNKAFSAWLIENAFTTDANGNPTAEGFFTDENGKAYTKEFAESELNKELKNPHYTDQIKDLILDEYYNKYQGGKTDEEIVFIDKARTLNNNVEISYDANVVDVTSNTYASSDFGKFNDTGKKDSGQETYLSKIIEDAQNEKINVGQIILPNYGENKGNIDAYMYAGDGKFVKVDLDGDKYTNEEILQRLGNFYIPKGYKDSRAVTTQLPIIRKE